MIYNKQINSLSNYGMSVFLPIVSIPLNQGCTTFCYCQPYNFHLYEVQPPVSLCYIYEILPSANQHTTHSIINCVFILQLFAPSPSRLLHIVSTDFFALHLFCFHICQHRRQVLYLKLHVDGRKFHYRRPHAAVRPQVVHRCAIPIYFVVPLCYTSLL